MRLRSFHHVQLALPPGGEEEATRFYAGVLGLERVQKPPGLAGRGGAWFRGPRIEVHLGVDPGHVPSPKAHVAFLVEDLDSAAQSLQDAGAEVSLSEEWSLPGFRRLHALDPFGNRLEFLEERSGGGGGVREAAG